MIFGSNVEVSLLGQSPHFVEHVATKPAADTAVRQLDYFLVVLCEVRLALDEVAVPHTVSDEFDRFRDVMVADATVLRLHRFLRDEYQGLREEQAGAKLHLLHNVTDQTLEQISITGERPHDSTEFDTGS